MGGKNNIIRHKISSLQHSGVKTKFLHFSYFLSTDLKKKKNIAANFNFYNRNFLSKFSF